MAHRLLNPSNMLISVLGAVAALLTIGSFVPQAWRIIKTRNTRDLATAMWVCSTSAFAVWTVYGVLAGKLEIIVPNAVCFILAGFILTLKLLPSQKRDKVADAVEETVGAITPGRPS